MPYTINKYNGQELTTVNDGTINTTLDIALIGKNAARYGELQNENFVHMLENFAGTYEPPKALLGQLWYDSLNNQLKFYDTNSTWKSTSGITASSSQPINNNVGELWYDIVSENVFVWNGSQWVLVGTQNNTGWIKNYGKTDTLTVLNTDSIQVPIVFDTEFTAIPVITNATILSLDNILVNINVSLDNITTTGMTINVGNTAADVDVTCVIAWVVEGY